MEDYYDLIKKIINEDINAIKFHIWKNLEYKKNVTCNKNFKWFSFAVVEKY